MSYNLTCGANKNNLLQDTLLSLIVTIYVIKFN